MHIIDNFISLEYQKQIKTMLSSIDCPWYFFQSNVDEGYQNILNDNYNLNSSYTDNPQFSHMFFYNEKITTSESNFNILKPLLELIENKFDIKNSNKNKLFRIKANLLLPSRRSCEIEYNVPHTDHDKECNSVLYYVNDSDGDTILFREKLNTFQGTFTKDITISPKMGRILFFDSTTYHTSCCPINSKYRIVINFVYV